MKPCQWLISRWLVSPLSEVIPFASGEKKHVITTVRFLTTYCDDLPSMMIYQSEPPEFVCENCMTVSQEYLMDYHVGFENQAPQNLNGFSVS